ncbi:MAG TPA: class I SAM-dependent methyltransferase [Anaerolineaceae bacterium]|nr:class I SAM-dependent methyltransferase [Anaerolineaceae bacterium]
MNCLLCSSQNLSPIREINGYMLKQRWQAEFGIDISTEIRDVILFKQLYCENCKIQFFDPLNAGSSDLYKQLERFDWYYQQNKWEYTRALQDLPGCDRVVEIGSGYGYFAEHARKALKLNIHGIEINPDAVVFARAKGLTVDLVSLEELAAQKPGYYQAVCAFQVLEHVDNPRSFLRSCCDLLVPGGKLILSIPNGMGFQFKLDLLLDMPPHHLSIWNPETLSKLARIYSLDLMKLEFEPLPPYHVDLWMRYCLPEVPSKSLVLRALRKIARKTIHLYLFLFPFQNFLRGMGMYAVFVKR